MSKGWHTEISVKKKKEKSRGTWIKRDGTIIEISEMEDTHLVNSIRMMQRMAPVVHQRAVSLCYAAISTLQGEMASFYATRDTEIIESMSPKDFLIERYPKYGNLVREAKRRGLPFPKF